MRQKMLKGLYFGPMCPCGNVGVKKMPGSYWSCQSCLDKDAVVEEIHRSMVPPPESQAISDEERIRRVRSRYFWKKAWKAERKQRGSAWRHKLWQAQPNNQYV